jgi:hypothetical protein
MKKILMSVIFVFCLMLLWSPFVVNAQSVNSSTSSSGPSDAVIPVTIDTSSSGFTQNDVSVNSVVLDKDTYNSGDQAVVIVNLNNNGQLDQPDVYLDVSLQGDYSTDQGRYNIANTVYDTKTFGPYTANGNGDTKISINYPLPKFVSGKNLGINVRAHTVSGIPYGWNDAFIKEITGNPILISLINFYTNVDGMIHSSGSGPTIGATSTVNFHLIAKNISNKNIDIIPVVEIHDRNSYGKLITKYSEKQATIVSGKSNEFVLNPYKNNSIPGVYVADVTLTDTLGNQVAEPVEFRYILPGDIATIHSVQFDQNSVSKDETVNFKISYSGTPFDISTLQSSKLKGATLNLSMLEANSGDLVGSTTVDLDFSNDSNYIVVPVRVLDDANSIKAVVTIEKDGKTLSTYTTSASTPDIAKISASNQFKNFNLYVVIAHVTTLVLLVLLFLLFRKRGAHGILQGFIIVLIVIIAFALTIQISRAEQTLNYCPSGLGWDPNNKSCYRQGTSSYHIGRGSGISSQTPGCYIMNDSLMCVTGFTPFSHTMPDGSPVQNTTSISISSYTTRYAVGSSQKITISGTVYSSGCMNTPDDMLVEASLVNTSGNNISLVQSNYSYFANNVSVHDGAAANNKDFSFTFDAPSVSSVNGTTFYIKLHVLNDWGRINLAQGRYGNTSAWEIVNERTGYFPVSTYKDLSVTCSGSPTTTSLNAFGHSQPVTWTATPTGGTGNYKMWWGTTGIEQGPSTSRTYTTTYTTPGSKQVWVVLNDGVTELPAKVCPAITVTPYVVDCSTQMGPFASTKTCLSSTTVRTITNPGQCQSVVDTACPNGQQCSGDGVCSDGGGNGSCKAPNQVCPDGSCKLDCGGGTGGGCQPPNQQCSDGSCKLNCGGGGGSCPANTTLCSDGLCKASCGGSGGGNPIQPLITKFEMVPNTVNSGKSCNMNYSANAESCNISGPAGFGSVSLPPDTLDPTLFSASLPTLPLDKSSQQYVMTCNGTELDGVTATSSTKHATCYLNASVIEH